MRRLTGDRFDFRTRLGRPSTPCGCGSRLRDYPHWPRRHRAARRPVTRWWPPSNHPYWPRCRRMACRPKMHRRRAGGNDGLPGVPGAFAGRLPAARSSGGGQATNPEPAPIDRCRRRGGPSGSLCRARGGRGAGAGSRRPAANDGGHRGPRAPCGGASPLRSESGWRPPPVEGRSDPDDRLRVLQTPPGGSDRALRLGSAERRVSSLAGI